MNDDVLALRIAVGLLGEKDQFGWWPSGFLAPTSAAFLTPVFGKHSLQAKYQGVVEAARKVHDDRIGVGRVFHLFRLPETMEQRLFESFGAQETQSRLERVAHSPAAAKDWLAALAGEPLESKPGPVLVGGADRLDGNGWGKVLAAKYVSAFNSGIQCFPYFSGAQ